MKAAIVAALCLVGCAHAPISASASGPALVVESPRPGELVRGPELDVRGRVDTYDGRAWVFAESTLAELTPPSTRVRFLAQRLPLRPGKMVVHVVATDGRGRKTEVEVPIVVESPDRPQSSALCRPGPGCLRYETRGVPRRDAEGRITNAVVVLSPFGFDERLDELWPDLVGPGRPLDTRERYIIGVAGAPDPAGTLPGPDQILFLLDALIGGLELHPGLALVGVSSYGAELALRFVNQVEGPVLLCGGHDRPFEEPAMQAVRRALVESAALPAEAAWKAVGRVMIPASYAPAYLAELGDTGSLIDAFAAHFSAEMPITELRRRMDSVFALRDHPLDFSSLRGRRIVLVGNRDDRLTSVSRLRALLVRLRLAGAQVSMHELADPLGHNVFFQRVPLELEQAVRVLFDGK